MEEKERAWTQNAINNVSLQILLGSLHSTLPIQRHSKAFGFLCLYQCGHNTSWNREKPIRKALFTQAKLSLRSPTNPKSANFFLNRFAFCARFWYCSPTNFSSQLITRRKKTTRIEKVKRKAANFFRNEILLEIPHFAGWGSENRFSWRKKFIEELTNRENLSSAFFGAFQITSK